MGVPSSEVIYTSAMPRREDHEVRQGHVGHWIKKIKKNRGLYVLEEEREKKKETTNLSINMEVRNKINKNYYILLIGY